MTSNYKRRKAYRLLTTEGGFTLIELLVATILFSLISLAFAYSLISGRSLSSSGGDRRQAITLAQQRLEGLRSQGFAAVELLVDAGSNEDPVTDFPDYRRVTEVVYLMDDNFSTEAPGATNTLRITVRVEPATGSGLTFAPVELYGVVAR
jgi:prepilin-type N-terminal cleavage/methylation domain-containing protein